MFLCELCDNWIQVERRPEHMDYHFALNMEKAERAEQAAAEKRDAKRKSLEASPKAVGK